ncbi:hypothetical protein BFJ63_vAg4830 [Fusarium oxysporum f. sp. narcissi]|uniref:Uncharacterized protein n=4 Tax=Fusarium oxysporum TaxID=5507 RepID=A0A420R0B2_FUSOX|nr:hypothetical protein FOMA001_g10147 [Fusarium oxysporum f. sp. matthiolae]KAJ0151944.1 Pre-mRNA-splicing factor SLU7 [Fusarium oxysporum f. sp. albedinis]KAJ4134229.1 hypothetical protein NW765_008262 [Fusarium oxysporum]RKK17063.1 hypothetical protein BFJ65_g10609 [Fusarium oxysporum f. sp. cepae]RYC92465.1 hypothetical protein BFJ63_vAg4830 [Fusarium oxysporum f. sp. narcissi]
MLLRRYRPPTGKKNLIACTAKSRSTHPSYSTSYGLKIQRTLSKTRVHSSARRSLCVGRQSDRKAAKTTT